MRVERFKCDRIGCYAESNGSTTGWWAISKDGYGVHILPLASVGQEGWNHLCGMEHAIAAVSDAMRAMQEAK